MRKKAAEIARSDWQFAPDAPAYVAAVEGQVNRALERCPGGDAPVEDARQLVEAIQDAIDVLEFAITHTRGDGA